MGVRSVPPPNHHCLVPGEQGLGGGIGGRQGCSFICDLNGVFDSEARSLASGALTVFLLDLKVSVVEVHGGDVGVLGMDHRAHTHGTER